jgi:hypothetical protein
MVVTIKQFTMPVLLVDMKTIVHKKLLTAYPSMFMLEIMQSKMVYIFFLQGMDEKYSQKPLSINRLRGVFRTRSGYDTHISKEN